MRRAIVAALGLSLLVGLVLIAFAWPGVRSAPRDVPLGVVGPAAAVSQVQQQLAAKAPGSFEVRAYDEPAAGESAVRNRDVYGLVVLAPQQKPRLVTASGASPAVAQLLTQLGGQLSGTPPAQPVDLAPLREGDPRGAGLPASVLPVLIGGVLSAIGLGRITSRPVVRATAAAVAAAGSGLVTALVLQTWLGSLGGGFWSVAGVAALGIGAVGLTLTGLHALLGMPGFGLGAATLVLLGNPLSGAGSAPELLPDGWSQLGQALPPGAYVDAMRSTAFFDGAGGSTPLLVLTGWIVLGLGLVAVAALRSRGKGPAPQTEPEHGPHDLATFAR